MSNSHTTPDNDPIDGDDYQKVLQLLDELEQRYRAAIAVYTNPEPPTGFAHMVAANWWWICVIIIGVILGASLYYLMPGTH